MVNKTNGRSSILRKNFRFQVEKSSSVGTLNVVYQINNCVVHNTFPKHFFAPAAINDDLMSFLSSLMTYVCDKSCVPKFFYVFVISEIFCTCHVE